MALTPDELRILDPLAVAAGLVTKSVHHAAQVNRDEHGTATSRTGPNGLTTAFAAVRERHAGCGMWAGEQAAMDRIAPTRRPRGMPVGIQLWRELLFLHWPVPVQAVRPLVPAPLSIDVYQGSAYVGLVPFVVRRARAAGTPATVGIDFLEANVRTYVHVAGRLPGVYFFSLDAASLLAVVGARLAFGLPYFPARAALGHGSRAVAYTLQRLGRTRPALAVRYEVGQPLGPSAPGTLEHFLLERYLLHVRRGPTLWTAQVHHRPYPAQTARVLSLSDQLIAAAGLTEPATPPPLVHYAAGVDVTIYPPQVRLSRLAAS